LVTKTRTKLIPTVQLRHELPDGEQHIDWLIAQDPAGSMPLITWRLARRVDELHAGFSMPAERRPDHRPRYLRYEGPLSGDRGRVRREAVGEITTSTVSLQNLQSACVIEVAWKKHGAILVQHLSLTPNSPENWIVACTRRHEQFDQACP
jgi:hypothetical protein